MSFHRLMKGDRLESPREPTSGWLVYNPELVLGQVELVSLKEKKKQLVDYRMINQQLISGELIQVREGTPAIAVARQGDKKLEENISNKKKVLLEVRDMSDRMSISLHQSYQRVREDALKKGEMLMSSATFYRLAARQRNDMPLFSGDANKGNRLPRFFRSVDETIVRLANELYLKPKSSYTLPALVDVINDEIPTCKGEADEIHVKSRPQVTQKYVDKVIRTRITPNPSAFRLPVDEVPGKTAIAAGRIIVKKMLERVEQDAVHLPMVIKTPDGGTFSNVWLVHSIDCSSGIPTGWHFVMGYPRDSDGLKCIERTCFPKTDELRKHGVDCTLDLFGAPNLIVFDNGPEAGGERIKQLSSIGIDTLHLKSRHPQDKPFIERLNLSLKKSLTTAAGSTRFDGTDGERDPVKELDPLMTFEELQTRIIRCYFESHIHTPLERHEWSDFHNMAVIGGTPAKRLEYAESHGESRSLSPTLTRWREATHLHESAKLNSKSGIPYDGFRYKGEKLIYLIHKYGETKVKFLVNPDDYREIFVHDGEGLPLVSLVEMHVETTTPAYSFAQMTQFNIERKAGREEHPTKTAFDKEMRAKDKAAASKRPRAAEKNKATSEKAKEADAVHRAAKRPLSAAPSVDHFPAGEIKTETFDNLPRLATSHKSSEPGARD